MLIDTQSIRNKIRDLAIQGQFTEHLQEDGSAVDLFQRIISDRQAKTDAGIIRRSPSLDESLETEGPVHLPRGWIWAQMESIGASIPNAFADGPFGSNLKQEHYTQEKQVRIIQLSNIGLRGWKNDNEKYTTFEHLKTIQRSEAKAGNIIIAKMMPAGRAVIVPDVSNAYVLSSDCIKFVPHPFLDARYICHAINSSIFHDQVVRDVHGIGRERTSLSKIKSYLIPLPPLAEQHRIVARIDAIFSLLDTIDALQSAYTANQKALRAKLIDAAIRGQLTEQLPEDGTAEELYRQIQQEKAALEKAGKIKKSKPLAPVTEKEKPFEVPGNWMWVRLNNLCSLVADIDHNMPRSVPPENGILFLSAKDLLNDGTINYTKDVKYISYADFQRLSRKALPQKNDIIYSRIGAALGKARLVQSDRTFLVSYSCCVIRPLCLLSKYLGYYLESSYILRFSLIARKSIGVPDLGMIEIKNYLIAVPPLAEQRRIVARLEELLAVCGG